MKRLSVLCLAILAVACAKKREPKYEYSLIEAFPQTIELKGDTLPINNLLDPVETYHVGDYLVVLTMSDEKFLYIYDAATHDSLAAFFVKGRGPNEVPLFLSAISQLYPEPGNNRAWLTNVSYFKGLFNIDKSIEQGKPVFDKMFRFAEKENIPEGMSIMNMNWMVNDSVMLWPEMVRKVLELEPNKNSFFAFYDYKNSKFLDTVRVSKYQVQDNYDVFAISLITADVRPDMKKAAVGFRHMDRLHIVDLETKDVKVIGIESMPDNTIVKAKDGMVFYNAIMATQGHIVILKKEGNRESGRNYLDVLTWDGEPVMQIYLDENLNYINITNPNYLYGITADDDPMIIRYDISSLNL